MASPRLIEEYVPLEYVGVCIAIYTFAQNLGILLSALMALILPGEHDEPALAADKKWRIMFGLPILMYTLMLLGFTTVIRYDSPKYYMSADRKQSAIRSIHKIYKTEGSDRIARTIFYHLESENTGDTSDVTLK